MKGPGSVKGASVGEGARVGEGASVGEGAWVGEGTIIKTSFDYILMGPFGSRQSMLTAHLGKGEKEILILTGCFCGSIGVFEKNVKEVHKDNQYAKQYEKAIVYIKSVFEERIRK